MYTALIQSETAVPIPIGTRLESYFYEFAPGDEQSRKFFLTSPRRLSFAASMGLDVLTSSLLGDADQFKYFIHSLGEEVKLAKPARDYIKIRDPLHAQCRQCVYWKWHFPVTYKTLLKKQTAWPLFNNSLDWEPVFQFFGDTDEGEHTYCPEDYCRHETPCDMN